MNTNRPASTPQPDHTRLRMRWFNLFAVLPCFIFFVIGFGWNQVGFFFLGLLFFPVAAVTVGLDVYFLYKRHLDKNM